MAIRHEMSYDKWLSTTSRVTRSMGLLFLFLQNVQISNSYVFFFPFLNIGPYGGKKFETVLLSYFSSDFYYDKYLSHGAILVVTFFWQSAKI